MKRYALALMLALLLALASCGQAEPDYSEIPPTNNPTAPQDSIVPDKELPEESTEVSTDPVDLRDQALDAVTAYNEQVQRYNEYIGSYNNAVNAILDANSNLSEEIEQAQAVLNTGDSPFDPQALIDFEQAVLVADNALIAVPPLMSEREQVSLPPDIADLDIADFIESLNAESEVLSDLLGTELPSVPDYSDIVAMMNDAEKAFQLGVMRMKQVTQPKDSFVLERLKMVESIIGADAVTKKHDPNGLLGKKGGYVGCIYFADNRIDKSGWRIPPSKYNVIDIGTVGGGCIEIYTKVEEAEARNEYLATFDGDSLDKGTHVVAGTLVIRVSEKLTSDQQSRLVEDIVAALIWIEDMEA